MKSKYSNYFILTIILFFLIGFLKYSDTVINSVIFSMNIVFKNVIPSLFPFFIISDLLINYNFVEILGNALGSLFNKIFGISKNGCFIFLLSIISGCPSNAKYINELLKNNQISIEEANHLLMFTHFSNPLFIIGTISILLNKKLAFLILFSHYISNLIIAFIFKRKNSYKNTKKEIKPLSFGIALTNSIIKNVNTILLITGVIVTFSVISDIITKTFNFNIYLQTLISGIFEITKGIKYISILNISLKLKAVFVTFLLSFGGLSIHMQVKSILSDYNIKYSKYFLSRLLHALISSFIAFLLIT